MIPNPTTGTWDVGMEEQNQRAEGTKEIRNSQLSDQEHQPRAKPTEAQWEPAPPS